MPPLDAPQRPDGPAPPHPPHVRRTVLDQLREKRFAAGLFCPHCNARRVQRWGCFADRQRYRCRDCRRTFSDLTATPLERTRYPRLWPRFCALLLEGVSVRECGRRLGINKSTAWRWRHRLLSELRITNPPALRGIVELHETTFAHSQKGSRRLRDALGQPRPPRRRGAGRGRGHRRAWVLLLQGRSATCRAEYVGERRPNVHRLLERLDEHSLRHVRAVLCPWGMLSAYGRLCRTRGIHFESASGVTSSLGATRSGAWHVGGGRSGEAPAVEPPSLGGLVGLRQVRDMERRLRFALRRFRGVATRYLPNYLRWFALYDEFRDPAERVLVRALGAG